MVGYDAWKRKKTHMAICVTCGNDYKKSFQVVMDGNSYTFDCFECAVQRLAPTCAHCGCRVIGHGVETGNDIFCCMSCERMGARPVSYTHLTLPTSDLV